MSLPLLETLGLTGKEADIYELLLKKGELTGGEIIAQTGLKRATVYKSLYSLEKKVLISKQDVNKKIHFKPLPPDRLLTLAEERIKEHERAHANMRTLLPDLMSTYILAVEKPVVTTFEGVKGLKEIYLDTLRVGKPIYAVLTTAEVDPELFSWLTETYGRLRTKHKIPASVIASSGTWSKEYSKRDAMEARTTLTVPHKLFPFAHEVDIYGDKVAFINYKKGDALIGIVINHPQIAQTMKAIFDLAWQGAQKL